MRRGWEVLISWIREAVRIHPRGVALVRARVVDFATCREMEIGATLESPSTNSDYLTSNAAYTTLSSMPASLEKITKDAMALSPHQKLALARILLRSAEAAADPEADVAWDFEIRDRMRAVDEGRTVGVPYEDVMRSAEARLVP